MSLDEHTPGTETHSLSFSVQGSLINRLAREKLYYENNLTAALQLILSCTETDQLDYDTRVGIAVAILDGTKELVGTYPGDDYGVEDVPEDRRPRQNLQSYVDGLLKKLDDLRRSNKTLMDKLSCVAELIPEHSMSGIDAQWRTQYFDPDIHEADANTIFGTTPQPAADMGTGSVFGSALLDSYMKRMTSECEEPDYGWLFPDGHFEPVEWGDHTGWAFNWLKEHEPDWYTKLKEGDSDSFDTGSLHFSDAGDYLQKHYKAVLLHNPALGVATLTASGELTKAQKEFMFDYYTKRGMTDKANALYSDSRESDRSY